MNPYESPAATESVVGPLKRGYNASVNVAMFFVKILFGVVRALLYLVGIVLGLTSMTIGYLNCGLECFGIGLFIWLIWNTCVTVAFSGYLISPISYLNAVGLFVLFKIFFGGPNKPADHTPKMETKDAQLEALTRRVFAAVQEARQRQAAAANDPTYRGASPVGRPSAGQGVDKGQPANGAGSGVRDGGR
jgi:hypothetical protein